MIRQAKIKTRPLKAEIGQLLQNNSRNYMKFRNGIISLNVHCVKIKIKY